MIRVKGMAGIQATVDVPMGSMLTANVSWANSGAEAVRVFVAFCGINNYPEAGSFLIVAGLNSPNTVIGALSEGITSTYPLDTSVIESSEVYNSHDVMVVCGTDFVYASTIEEMFSSIDDQQVFEGVINFIPTEAQVDITSVDFSPI